MTSPIGAEQLVREGVSVPFRSASETPSSDHQPSTWVNIGVCVRSNLSRRYTRPGAISAPAADAPPCSGSASRRCACGGASAGVPASERHGGRPGTACPACRAPDARRHVERFEVVVVVLDLRALDDLEAHAREDLLDATAEQAEGMAVAEGGGPAGQRDVDGRRAGLAARPPRCARSEARRCLFSALASRPTRGRSAAGTVPAISAGRRRARPCARGSGRGRRGAPTPADRPRQVLLELLAESESMSACRRAIRHRVRRGRRARPPRRPAAVFGPGARRRPGS
jgi:hypothetical protein